VRSYGILLVGRGIAFVNGNVGPLLVTGGFTLAASVISALLVIYATSRQERRRSYESSYFRNLENRRSIIVDFLLVFDELRRLAESGSSSRRDYDDDTSFIGHLGELRRRLGEGRTSLDLFARSPTRPVVERAEQLGRTAWLALIDREPLTDRELSDHAADMRHYKETLILAFRRDLGEEQINDLDG
jgi:hypothetical protein